jgi:hypothetical protein
VHQYRRLRASSLYWKAQPPLLSYLRYLARLWRLERTRDIPLFVARKALAKVSSSSEASGRRGRAAA